MSRTLNEFQTIRSEGGLLPPDILLKIVDPDDRFEGTRPTDYSLPEGERLNEAITQSWNRLKKYWTDFKEASSNLSPGDAGEGLTNDKWTVPLLTELGFGRLPTSAGPIVEGKTYPIKRFFGSVPIHFVGCGVDIDKRSAGVAGAAKANPHGMIQEFLNREEKSTWAVLSNGKKLRILRDNNAVSRQTFVEFDLESMFDGEVYSDFVLFWLLTHATRFEPQEPERPDSCWLEKWTKIAAETGTRALGDLRSGVEDALRILGKGFTSHPRNTYLREQLRSGLVKPTDLHAQLLRVVYRFIFLFVAEDRTIDGRPLLHPIEDSEQARTGRARYADYYSTRRLRYLAQKIKGTRHGDLWKQFQVTVNALSGEEGSEEMRRSLSLPALGSFLWDPSTTDALNGAEITNFDLLEAIRRLAFIRQGKTLRAVDYKNLGAEELGGVYEGLLALTPQIIGGGAEFDFLELAGNERKTSGSYYTPDSLVQCLLDSALDPVVQNAIKGKSGSEAESAILDLKVCDPAVGSGHFLVGAARRLATHLARVRSHAAGEGEPSPLLYQQALRDVIGRCLYGVDINPMSAELCRVNLWLEALEPGKPLSFLDHHIQVGNSLLGTTPELIEKGLPDEAFTPISGDDKATCSALKKRNKIERDGKQRSMFDQMEAGSSSELKALEKKSKSLNEAPDTSIVEVKRKADQFRAIKQSPEYQRAKTIADLWCAAFVWPRVPNAEAQPPTTDTIRNLDSDDNQLSQAQQKQLRELSRQYQFFHFHLAFPEVAAKGGFDCMLGNPPWERIKLQEKEWFAARGRPDITNAQNAAARKRAIEVLRADDPELFEAFQQDIRAAEGGSHLIRASGGFPLCGRGDINVYTIFAELMRTRLNDDGLFGAVLPSGIATDDTTKFYFQDVVSTGGLRSVFDFENRLGLFPDVDSRMKFCLFTSGKRTNASSAPSTADFAFFCHSVEDIKDDSRRFTLSSADIELLNPNTKTCSVFRSSADAELTKAVYRRLPVIAKEKGAGSEKDEADNPWGLQFRTLFHMSNDSILFRTRKELEGEGWSLQGNSFVNRQSRYLPLYEPKMIHHFDHRWASFSDTGKELVDLGNKSDPNFEALPQYWVEESDVTARLHVDNLTTGWLMGYRNITNTTNERTLICSIFPIAAVSNQLPVFVTSSSVPTILPSIFSSIALDFFTRFKVGGSALNFFIARQLPVPKPEMFSKPITWCDKDIPGYSWIQPRALELTYTTWNLSGFSQSCGFDGPPFRWDQERRAVLRAELDAAFFHLYLPATAGGKWKPARKEEGAVHDETLEQLTELEKHFPTPRDAVSYIMDTFPIVKRKDEEKYGEYRTKNLILDIYDRMQEAMVTSKPYETLLDPPPADPSLCHPPRE